MKWFSLPDTFRPDLTIGSRSLILSHVNFGQALALGLAVRVQPLIFLSICGLLHAPGMTEPLAKRGIIA
jgi:hypothetical protein